jgi:hypothetical protein
MLKRLDDVRPGINRWDVFTHNGLFTRETTSTRASRSRDCWRSVIQSLYVAIRICGDDLRVESIKKTTRIRSVMLVRVERISSKRPQWSLKDSRTRLSIWASSTFSWWRKTDWCSAIRVQDVASRARRWSAAIVITFTVAAACWCWKKAPAMTRRCREPTAHSVSALHHAWP